LPASRLLVVADPKMLSALASGLRESTAFEVAVHSFADAGALASAASQAEALALFYGTAERPLPSWLQDLAPAARERGVRVVAVLQKDQAALRDSCFRAGASEVLFMPAPKEQFRAQLAEALALAYPGGPGKQAKVSLSTRTASAKLEAAVVTSAGIHAPAKVDFRAGETVRLGWAAGVSQLQSWGLVAKSGPDGVQVRFAGLSSGEEAKLREWLRDGEGARVAAAAPEGAGRAIPAAPEGGGRPTAATLFDEEDGAVAPLPAAPAGPVWPVGLPPGAIRELFGQALAGRVAAANAPADLAAAAGKIVDRLSSSERALLDQEGAADSPFAEALAVRLALTAAASEGVRLSGQRPPAAVDAAAVAALSQQADAATAGLQLAADLALGKGDVERLQVVSAASAALTRDRLAFKETADRLRGLRATPRLRAGALDPEVQVSGPRRPAARPAAGEPVAKRESRDFDELDPVRRRVRRQRVLAAVAVLLFAAALSYVLVFGQPSVRSLSPEVLQRMGGKVLAVTLVDQTALVNVSKTFFTEDRAQNLAALCQALRAHHVDKALLRMDTAPAAGQVDIGECKAIALPVELVREEGPPSGTPAGDGGSPRGQAGPATSTRPP
jgi:DNA-binding NarL/FixJ family response regulator